MGRRGPCYFRLQASIPKELSRMFQESAAEFAKRGMSWPFKDGTPEIDALFELIEGIPEVAAFL